MKNWSVDINSLKKNKEAYEKFKLEQLINYGLDGEKLSIKALKKYLPELHLDKKKREFAEFLVS